MKGLYSTVWCRYKKRFHGKLTRSLKAEVASRVLLARNFECHVTKFAPHKELESITPGKLTFAEMVVLHPPCGRYKKRFHGKLTRGLEAEVAARAAASPST